VGASIKPLFPNANDRGSHINISGVALTKHAPNKANAVALMEFLASEERRRRSTRAQITSTRSIQPFLPSEIVQSWGKLKPDRCR